MTKITLQLFTLVLICFLTCSILTSRSALALDIQTTNAPKTVKERIVVLIPGFFNSFAPEYFSQDIVKSIHSQGFRVIVAQKLNPIGSIVENGESVFKLLISTHNLYPKAEINIISHSAGGFYSLYAINKGAYFIKNLMTVSTPFNGVEFVENWNQRVPLFQELLHWCSLDSVKELTTPFAQRFLASIKIPNTLRILSYGGYQPASLDIWNAANLSSLLTVTNAFIPGASDGIVSFKSATTKVSLTTFQNTLKNVNVDVKFYIGLEHWEQVLDYRHFVVLGSRNIGLIQDRQIKFYSGLARLLASL